MSRLDEVFFRRFWPETTATDVRAEPTSSPEPVSSPLLTTSYEKTKPEVSAAEQAVADRLAGLVADGLSPLEAARLLFAEGRSGVLAGDGSDGDGPSASQKPPLADVEAASVSQ